MNDSRPPAPPKRLHFIRETRALADFAGMTLPLLGAAIASRRAANGTRIMLLPGFGADDHSMRPLQFFLAKSGYTTEGWGLGRNLAGMNLAHDADALSDGWSIDPDRPWKGEEAVPFLADRVVVPALPQPVAASLVDAPLAGLGAILVVQRDLLATGLLGGVPSSSKHLDR